MSGTQYPKKIKIMRKAKSDSSKEASARFKKITKRAQKIREKHPKMKWKNAIKKASKELF
jgi:hypothetical protein